MLEDKNSFLDNNEENDLPVAVEVIDEPPTEEKIGFSSTPISKEEKKNIRRFQKDLPGKPLRGWLKATFILGIIFTSLSFMYFLLPIFCGFIGALIALVLVLFMILSVVFTLGLVLTSEDYRSWIGNHMMDVPNWFFNISEHIWQLNEYFPVVAIPAVVFTTISLTLSIIGQAKYKKYYISYIVVSSIFFVSSLLILLFYLVLGNKVIINQ